MNQTTRVMKSAADELPADIVDLAAVISQRRKAAASN